MGLGTLGIVNVTVSANAVVTLSSALSAERIAYFPLLNCTITNFNGAWAAFSGTGTMSITNSTTIQTNINTLTLPAYSGNGGELSTLSTGNAANRMGGTPAGYAGMFIDGRRRAHHGWYDQWFFNGKAWDVNQGSCTGVGNSTSHAWSFDRSYAVPTAMPTAPGQAPQAWQNNAGPWKWLGTSDTGAKLLTSISGDSLGNSPAVALDPVTGIIWYAHGDGGNWFAGFGSLNTATEALVHVDMPQPCQQPFGHSAICVDPAWDGVFGDPNNTCRWRFFVFFPQGGLNQIAILDLKAANPYLPASWTIGAISSSTGVATVGNGAVYHKASRSVICANPVAQQDGIVYKVRVPTNPATGVYVGGTWNVSPINPDTVNGNVNPGLNQTTGQGGGNAFGKLRLVESISGGQDGIVICSGVTLPTYVYKLPAAEIV
jgi:hypothetical protein